MSQLTLEHVSAYLPYKVKAISDDNKIRTVIWGYQSYDTNFVGMRFLFFYENSINKHKLILRPLSDLTKEITVDGGTFVPIDKLLGSINSNYTIELYHQDKNWIISDGYNAIKKLSFEKVQRLLSLHFDIFELIEKDLAIDINTLNK